VVSSEKVKATSLLVWQPAAVCRGDQKAIMGSSYRQIPSTAIRLDQATNAIQAAGHAVQIGLPLNAFVTLLLERADQPGRAGDHLRAWLERANKWLRYHGLPETPHVWTLENSSYTGLHAHLLMNIPASLRPAFKRQAVKWLGGEKQSNLVVIEGVRYGHGINQLNKVKGVLRYILKNIDVEAGEMLKIEPQARDRVLGKRIGVAQCVGPAARAGQLQKRVGWRSRRAKAA
jgi:hypothetical protein